MSTFTTPIVLRLLDDERKWELYEDFEYHIGTYPSKQIIKVKKGFKTDLASVPRVLLPFFNPLQTKYAKPALVHDWLYAKKDSSIQDRKLADKIFLEAMSVMQAPKMTKYTIYGAVRCFGWLLW